MHIGSRSTYNMDVDIDIETDDDVIDYWSFRLFLKVWGHYVAYFWGPGTSGTGPLIDCYCR